jgi:hypothetical protein
MYYLGALGVAGEEELGGGTAGEGLVYKCGPEVVLVREGKKERARRTLRRRQQRNHLPRSLGYRLDSRRLGLQVGRCRSCTLQ